MMMENPKVFISHATEDKDRFVKNFARALIKYGIDAWYDDWEMKKGDSLTQKIFYEGIKNAEAMIIVLSKNSINKPWVKKEIDAGFMKHMQGNCKLIPVILDNVKPPEILSSVIWSKIDDIDDYSKQIEEIVASIFDISKKPAVGNIPRYVSIRTIEIPGLSQIDNILLKNICEIAIEIESFWVQSSDLKRKIKELEIPSMNLEECFDILENGYYIEGNKAFGEIIPSFFKVTNHGFEEYLNYYVPQKSEYFKDIVSAILNENLKKDTEFTKILKIPLLIVQFFIQKLEEMNAIIASSTNSGMEVVDANPLLRRVARDME